MTGLGGVTMVTAIYSSHSREPVDNGLAMTGEVSIRGLVKPVGGVVAKLEAARLAGAARDHSKRKLAGSHFGALPSTILKSFSPWSASGRYPFGRAGGAGAAESAAPGSCPGPAAAAAARSASGGAGRGGGLSARRRRGPAPPSAPGVVLGAALHFPKGNHLRNPRILHIMTQRSTASFILLERGRCARWTNCPAMSRNLCPDCPFAAFAGDARFSSHGDAAGSRATAQHAGAGGRGHGRRPYRAGRAEGRGSAGAWLRTTFTPSVCWAK